MPNETPTNNTTNVPPVDSSQVPVAPITNPAEIKEPGIEGSASLEVSYNDILNALVSGYGKKGTDDGKKKFAEVLSSRLKQVIRKHDYAKNYNILILFDNTTLVKSDSDSIYRAISGLEKNEKPLLLILLSRGGELGSAYLIGQLCRESSNKKFIVVIPRHAKSAATLLATAADEIHMGSLSELGPIDPQIENMPALGLKNSIEHIAELVNKNPGSSQMFAKYLTSSIEPIQIGYYERVAESAAQYAERLLSGHKDNLAATPAEIAYRLVYGYKDHGFVIDKTEAKNIFGDNTVKSSSDEYKLGDAIYVTLSEVLRIADLLGYTFYFIGSPDSEPKLIKQKD
jgi:hypothetical protein